MKYVFIAQFVRGRVPKCVSRLTEERSCRPATVDYKVACMILLDA